jgi:hypothetical protein
MRLVKRLLSRLNNLFALGAAPLSSPEARARQAEYFWSRREKATGYRRR